MKCRYCDIELTQENTYPSRWRTGKRSCVMCDQKQNSEWLKNNPRRAQATQKLGHRRRRLAALLAYGCECECCGIKNPEFLSFQHANGNGKKHRDTFPRGVDPFLKDIKDRGYPVRFDLPDGTPIHIKILCHNCHYSTDHYGYCPHKEDKSDFDIPIQMSYCTEDKERLDD